MTISSYLSSVRSLFFHASCKASFSQSLFKSPNLYRDSEEDTLDFERNSGVNWNVLFSSSLSSSDMVINNYRGSENNRKYCCVPDPALSSLSGSLMSPLCRMVFSSSDGWTSGRQLLIHQCMSNVTHDHVYCCNISLWLTWTVRV